MPPKKQEPKKVEAQEIAEVAKDVILVLEEEEGFSLSNVNMSMLSLFLKNALKGQKWKAGGLASIDVSGQRIRFRFLLPPELNIPFLPGSHPPLEYFSIDFNQTKLSIQPQIAPYQESEALSPVLPESQLPLSLKSVLKQTLGFVEMGLGLIPMGDLWMNGLLLLGTCGSGKTWILSALKAELQRRGISCILIDCFSLDLEGSGERRILEAFREASQAQPSVVFVDNLELLVVTPGKASSGNQAAFANGFDGLHLGSKKNVVVVSSATNKAQIPQSLLRSGRFDKTIELEPPNARTREELIRFFGKEQVAGLSKEELQELAQNMNGFSLSDVRLFLRDSLLPLYASKEEEPRLSLARGLQTIKAMQPDSLRDLLVEFPKVFWREIGGYASVKAEVKKVLEWPLRHPEAFERLGLTVEQGILLYGPPGCCKTMIAKAIATESSFNFISVKGPEVLSKYVGESEKAIRELFRKARLSAPCVIFFDEVDSIAGSRSDQRADVSNRVLNQLLIEMDGFAAKKNVVVLAATNRPDIIDKALTRPGRLGQSLYVGPPDFEARVEIFRVSTEGKMPLAADVDLKELAKSSEGFSGADIASVCQRAGMNALVQDLGAKQIAAEHFKEALKSTKPSITQEMLSKYQAFQRGSQFLGSFFEKPPS